MSTRSRCIPRFGSGFSSNFWFFSIEVVEYRIKRSGSKGNLRNLTSKGISGKLFLYLSFPKNHSCFLFVLRIDLYILFIIKQKKRKRKEFFILLKKEIKIKKKNLLFLKFSFVLYMNPYFFIFNLTFLS